MVQFLNARNHCRAKRDSARIAIDWGRLRDLCVSDQMALLGLSVRSVLIDACNLQLNVETARPSSLESRTIDALPRRLHLLARYLAYLDPWSDDVPLDVDAPAAITAVFDGSAFYGEHAAATWVQRDEAEGAPAGCGGDGLRVVFTQGPTYSADDAILALATEAAGGAPPQPPLQISAKKALADLEAGELPRPVIRATRLKAVSGKAERKRREAFLNSCGLPRIGDTAHLPAFTAAQRERSISLVRGLSKLGDVITFRQLNMPNAIVVSDDRGLRRRCLDLPLPPVVLSSSQFYHWLDWLPPDPEEDDVEELVVVE